MELCATLLRNCAHPQKSHAIPPSQFSTPPRNVAIPTTPLKCLKGLHGNCMRHCWETMPAMLVMPGSTSARHLAAPTHHPEHSPPQQRSPPHTVPPNAAHPRNAAPHAHCPPRARCPPQERSTPRTLPVPRTQHPTHTARPTHTERAPASSHGDRGRGRGRLSRRARAYSLTPPAVRPETMYFCRYWKSRMTGMAARTAPAAKMPHGAVRSSAAHMYMPTASVNWL